MGYTTEFWGEIEIEPPLNEEEIAYLKKFSDTRRMNRGKGDYFVDGTDAFGQGQDKDIIDYNASPPEQPGLWCNWIPSVDGTSIEWDGGEKFYSPAQWMWYIIWHFLSPNPIAKIRHPEQFAFLEGHVCNGEIDAQGEDGDDRWKLIVIDNVVSVQDSEIVFRESSRIVNPILEMKYCFEVNKDSSKCNTCDTRFKCYTDEKVPELRYGNFGGRSYWRT